MVWNDKKITEWAGGGGVTPFLPELVNPASLDLRMGNQIREPHPMWGQMFHSEMMNRIGDGTIDDMPKWSEPQTFDVFWLLPHRFVLCHSLEFVQIPVTCSCILVLKSSWGRKGLNHSHCLAGDTMIDVPRDLSVNPNGIAIRELVGKDFCVYAFDTQNMKFVLSPATAFPTKRNTQVVRVKYEWMTGRKWKRDSVVCTPDHRFLTLDGRWMEAQNLTNERLMPLWRWKDGRYAGLCVDPVNKRNIREHRFIGESLYKIGGAHEIHHINENKIDNRVENLMPLMAGEHQSFHSSGNKNPFYGKRHSDEVREHLSKIRTGKKLSESHRRSMSIASSGSNNPRYVEIGLDQIVSAYNKTGKIVEAAASLGVHECTLLNKIRSYGFDGARDFKKKISEMDNHKVTGVEWISETQDTFDIHVPNYHSFVANGVVVHNSGWGDPGFGLKSEIAEISGAQWTFELQNISPWPIKLTAGDRIIQQVFFDMSDVPLVDYRSAGHYVYQSGATPAKE